MITHMIDGCMQAFNLLGLGGPALDNRKVRRGGGDGRAHAGVNVLEGAQQDYSWLWYPNYKAPHKRKSSIPEHLTAIMYDKSGPDLRVCANRGPPSHFLIPPPPKQVVSLWQWPCSCCTRAGANKQAVPPPLFLPLPPPKQVVSLWQQPRSCTRAGADQLDFVCTDFTGI